MSNLPKNQKQFELLHMLANMPFANLRKLAKLTNNEYTDIVLVKNSVNYEHWKATREGVDNLGDLDFMSDLFGTGKH